MSKVLEFNELARKNREMKFGSMEYNSLLPDLQIMINGMYGSLVPNPDVNYVTATYLCPNLEAYNVHYVDEDFKTLNVQISNKTQLAEDVVINHAEKDSTDIETLEVMQTRTMTK